ncbi:MAG: FkbM family methyltransferase [Planctomyces sp.]|nr:FkbM family methyltransferase [Planctomyces sp.]
MGSLAKQMRYQVTAALQRFGIHEQALDALRLFDPRSRPFRKQKQFSLDVGNTTVRFHTDDPYSNAWFYPRLSECRTHEQSLTERLVSGLQNVRCFVDIGTNLGWYTCIAASLLPQGVVYGFEMDKVNFGLLQRNLSLNRATNVLAYHLAASDTDAVETYQRNGIRPGTHFQLNKHGRGLPVEVKSVTMDRFFDHTRVPPDVVKIDVEGAEHRVLLGMKRLLVEQRPTIFMELHPQLLPNFGSTSKDVIGLLIGHNYQITRLSANHSGSASPARLSLYQPITSDTHFSENDHLLATPLQ